MHVDALALLAASPVDELALLGAMPSRTRWRPPTAMVQQQRRRVAEAGAPPSWEASREQFDKAEARGKAERAASDKAANDKMESLATALSYVPGYGTAMATYIRTGWAVARAVATLVDQSEDWNSEYHRDRVGAALGWHRTWGLVPRAFYPGMDAGAKGYADELEKVIAMVSALPAPQRAALERFAVRLAKYGNHATMQSVWDAYDAFSIDLIRSAEAPTASVRSAGVPMMLGALAALDRGAPVKPVQQAAFDAWIAALARTRSEAYAGGKGSGWLVRSAPIVYAEVAQAAEKKAAEYMPMFLPIIAGPVSGAPSGEAPSSMPMFGSAPSSPGSSSGGGEGAGGGGIALVAAVAIVAYVLSRRKGGK